MGSSPAYPHEVPTALGGTWWEQPTVEMLQTGSPMSWQKQINSSVHSKPEDVIKLPIIITTNDSNWEHT